MKAHRSQVIAEETSLIASEISKCISLIEPQMSDPETEE